MRQRLLLQRPLIAWMSSDFLICLRRSRVSSVKALTSWPFGRNLKGGAATRNRCFEGIQLIHIHVVVDKRSATPGLQKKNPQIPVSFCMLELPTYALLAHHHPEPHHHQIQLPRTLQPPPRHKCNTARSRPVCRTGGRPPNHFTTPTRAVEEAAVPTMSPINANRVATTGRAWCCVANVRFTMHDRTAASSQRASAMRPTMCGHPESWALHCGSVCVFVEAPHSRRLR